MKQRELELREFAYIHVHLHHDILLVDVNLERPVETRKSAQIIDFPGAMKKWLIINKVTAHFFITLFESIICTSFSRLTDLSRLKEQSNA